MDLVTDLAQQVRPIRFATVATVAIGVSIGVVLSAVVVAFFWCVALLIRRTRAFDADAAASVVEDIDAVDDSIQQNTAGAYRSDSDDSDDGEGARAAKQAQKRSRKRGSV